MDLPVVFISDLHLHPNEKAIKARFDSFIIWAKNSVKTIYILGDFFHAWPGDDAINEWSQSVASQLLTLTQLGIKIFYMPGNRDFLLGKTFAKRTGWIILPDPTLIDLGNEQVMLTHGDQYCTKDREHQRFRMLTRNKLFTYLFLKLSLKTREQLVNKVRTISLSNRSKTLEQMDVVPEAVIKQMTQYKSKILIHGHTHKPGLSVYPVSSYNLMRYVLSDWDDKPKVLCYDNTKGFHFTQQ